MSIITNVSIAMRKYKEFMNLSLSDLSNELGIPVSSLQCYLNGASDLRASTIELLAKKTHTPLTEMVSGPTPEWERAETVLRAVKEIADLPIEKQRQCIQLFLQLVALFTTDT